MYDAGTDSFIAFSLDATQRRLLDDTPFYPVSTAQEKAPLTWKSASVLRDVAEYLYRVTRPQVLNGSGGYVYDPLDLRASKKLSSDELGTWNLDRTYYSSFPPSEKPGGGYHSIPGWSCEYSVPGVVSACASYVLDAIKRGPQDLLKNVGQIDASGWYTMDQYRWKYKLYESTSAFLHPVIDYVSRDSDLSSGKRNLRYDNPVNAIVSLAASGSFWGFLDDTSIPADNVKYAVRYLTMNRGMLVKRDSVPLASGAILIGSMCTKRVSGVDSLEDGCYPSSGYDDASSKALVKRLLGITGDFSSMNLDLSGVGDFGGSELLGSGLDSSVIGDAYDLAGKLMESDLLFYSSYACAIPFKPNTSYYAEFPSGLYGPNYGYVGASPVIQPFDPEFGYSYRMTRYWIYGLGRGNNMCYEVQNTGTATEGGWSQAFDGGHKLYFPVAYADAVNGDGCDASLKAVVLVKVTFYEGVTSHIELFPSYGYWNSVWGDEPDWYSDSDTYTRTHLVAVPVSAHRFVSAANDASGVLQLWESDKSVKQVADEAILAAGESGITELITSGLGFTGSREDATQYDGWWTKKDIGTPVWQSRVTERFAMAYGDVNGYAMKVTAQIAPTEYDLFNQYEDEDSANGTMKFHGVRYYPTFPCIASREVRYVNGSGTQESLGTTMCVLHHMKPALKDVIFGERENEGAN